MSTRNRLSGIKRLGVMGSVGTTFALPLGACDLGEFTTTTTTTLDGREIVMFLVRSAVLTPIDNFIGNAIDKFFDQFDDDAA